MNRSIEDLEMENRALRARLATGENTDSEGWQVLEMGAIRLMYHSRSGKTQVSLNDSLWIYSSDCARDALLALSVKASGYPHELGAALHLSSPATAMRMPLETEIRSEHCKAVMAKELGGWSGDSLGPTQGHEHEYREGRWAARGDRREKEEAERE
jgi:hypothetical protein